MSRQYVVRDTAKDIILGTNPSGVNVRGTTGRFPDIDNTRSLAPVTYVSDGSAAAISDLQSQLRLMQQRSDQQLANEQESRRRLESQLRQSNDALAQLSQRQKLSEGNNMGTQQLAMELDSQRQARAVLEAQVLRMTQDIAHMKGMIDRHSSDLMALNNEVKSRPIIDPSKMNNTQFLETKLRDLHGEIMTIRQSVDGEVNDRRRNEADLAASITRLQGMLGDQDQRRNDLMRQITNTSSNKSDINAETKRLNDKIQLITDEVTRSLANKEQALRDENRQQYLALEKAIKAELEARLLYERDVRQYLESKWRNYNDEINGLKEGQTAERAKNKEKMQKINEALAVLEQHLEQGNRKIDRVMAAEIQSRKLHEKALLAKLAEIEERLGGHFKGLNSALDEVRRSSSSNSPAPPVVPNLDTEALRKELDAIAADKHKLTMEGLLRLEEKLTRIERGVQRDNGDISNKLSTISDSPATANMDPDTLARLKHQLNKMQDMQDEIEKSHAKLRDKVEKQIPENLEELAAKQENMKKQMFDKVDQEEKTRQANVAELQDEISRLKNRPLRNTENPGGNSSGPANEKVQQEVDQCQIAIKKLAESVTTVKNVLSRKIDTETNTREIAIDKINARLDSK